VSYIHCTGCHGLVADLPDTMGPEHTYIGASPGCWTIYNEVQGQHLFDPKYGCLPFLAANTYMVQHPGVPGPQAINSVALHLIGLYGELEMKWPYEFITRIMGRAAQPPFTWLDPPGSFPLTIVHIGHTGNIESHAKIIREWGKTTWEAWSPHHAIVAGWAGQMARDLAG
jgi:hypothetical protein